MNTISKKTKSGVEFSYGSPESVQEAVEMFGPQKTLQMIQYAHSVAEAHKATASPPMPKGLTKALKDDPELMAKVAEMLRAKGLEL